MESNRTALLPDAGVRRAVHQAFTGEFEDGLLERPDEMQLGQHRAEQRRVGGVVSPRRWSTSSIHGEPVSRRLSVGIALNLHRPDVRGGGL